MHRRRISCTVARACALQVVVRVCVCVSQWMQCLSWESKSTLNVGCLACQGFGVSAPLYQDTCGTSFIDCTRVTGNRLGTPTRKPANTQSPHRPPLASPSSAAPPPPQRSNTSKGRARWHQVVQLASAPSELRLGGSVPWRVTRAQPNCCAWRQLPLQQKHLMLLAFLT